ncbi:translation initiation factor IF-2 [Chlamydiales bacterium]|nr:translation initiation factor IF-2 [Chlamydiales bacterium]
MSKQFKFNIKNNQLAEAINLTKVKEKLAAKKQADKPVAKKKKEEVIPPIEEAVEETPAAPRAKARKRSVFAGPKAEEEVVEKAPIKEVVPQEKVIAVTTLQLPKKACPEGLEKLKSQQKERLGPTGRHIRDIIPPPAPKKEVPKESKTSTSQSDKKGAVSKPDALKKASVRPKEYRDLKPAKLQQPTSFDSRDRQGLRNDDDRGNWKRRRNLKSKAKHEEIAVVRPTSLKVRLPTTIKDLAKEMKLKATSLISKLFLQGVIVTLNDSLDDETTVVLLGDEFGCKITIDTSEQERIRITDKTVSEEISEATSDVKKIRPPIVTFMGHVDHGKTSLIDKIRQANTASHEAGAITQHIGAFKCTTSVGEITILDTPGHEAFSQMRARGANATDIVVLVVAGDEGFRQQTEEALQHAKAAGVTIVVAINKSDKPNYNAETVYRQLADKELLPEAWGGQTITINTSATTGEGINSLLEMLALQAEILELTAVPEARARGIVLETEMHKGMGAKTTLLVLNGTLNKGDSLVFDTLWGRVKTIRDEFGKQLNHAGPSTPVEITGLSGLPEAGQEFIVVDNEKEAKAIAEKRALESKATEINVRRSHNLENLLFESQGQEKKVLNVILRADVQGSLEALKSALGKITSDKVNLNIIFTGIGEISESDIQLAAASKAVVLGFHNSIEQHAEQLVKELGIEIRLYDVIYHVIDEVKVLMQGQLDKVAKEEEKGKAEVLQTFKSSQLGIIAGCLVSEGVISRNHQFRLYRDKKVIWTGSITSLKRVKEDVKEVKQGIECGIVLSGTNDIQAGDLLESFEIVYITQVL